MKPAMGFCTQEITGGLFAVLADDLRCSSDRLVELPVCQMKPGCLEQLLDL
jgi:hypothetical protein